MEQGMRGDEIRAKKKLVEQWGQARAQLEQLRMFEVRPNDDFSRFCLNATSRDTPVIVFDVEPTTFLVPERASDFRSLPNLYISARGRIALNRAAIERQELVTDSFATEVAYFRHKGTAAGRSVLEHVYAAHFDHAVDEIGHPIFHVQMQSYPERADELARQYAIDGEVEDRLAGVLKTVRIPTAQMDFFSFLVQICADHLIHKDSGPEDLQAFEGLRESTKSIIGARHLLRAIAGADCTRGLHWYPMRSPHASA